MKYIPRYDEVDVSYLTDDNNPDNKYALLRTGLGEILIDNWTFIKLFQPKPERKKPGRKPKIQDENS